MHLGLFSYGEYKLLCGPGCLFRYSLTECCPSRFHPSHLLSYPWVYIYCIRRIFAPRAAMMNRMWLYYPSAQNGHSESVDGSILDSSLGKYAAYEHRSLCQRTARRSPRPLRSHQRSGVRCFRSANGRERDARVLDVRRELVLLN